MKGGKHDPKRNKYNSSRIYEISTKLKNRRKIKEIRK